MSATSLKFGYVPADDLDEGEPTPWYAMAHFRQPEPHWRVGVAFSPDGALVDLAERALDGGTLLFKRASKKLHPDAGGDPELFRKLVQAREVLTP